jgi:hypothetical protein
MREVPFMWETPPATLWLEGRPRLCLATGADRLRTRYRFPATAGIITRGMMMRTRFRTAVLLFTLLLPGLGVTAGFQNGDGDLPTLWRSVDAVAFLKIQTAAPPSSKQAGEGAFKAIEYRASVLEVFRRTRGQPQYEVTFLRDASEKESPESACKPGQECLVFLVWNNAEGAFQAYITIAVRNGKVQSPRIRGLESGMNLEAFLKILRSMMEQGRPGGQACPNWLLK